MSGAEPRNMKGPTSNILTQEECYLAYTKMPRTDKTAAKRAEMRFPWSRNKTSVEHTDCSYLPRQRDKYCFRVIAQSEGMLLGMIWLIWQLLIYWPECRPRLEQEIPGGAQEQRGRISQKRRIMRCVVWNHIYFGNWFAKKRSPSLRLESLAGGFRVLDCERVAL